MGSRDAVSVRNFASSAITGFSDSFVWRIVWQVQSAAFDPDAFRDESGDIGPRYDGDSRPRAVVGGQQAFCVRTCDGRYFQISAVDSQSRAASCNNFCPASETKVVYGTNIDNAVTETGKSYSDLSNAFRYRNELVAGCTCNGKDQIGLAPVKIENDPTLRKGDIIAGAGDLMISHRRGGNKLGAALKISPASRTIRAMYECAPILASD